MRLRPRSIRLRVTLLATTTTAVIVVAFGWLLTELVADDLVRSGEDALEELLDDVEGLSLVELGEEVAEFRVDREGVVAVVELDEVGDLRAELYRDGQEEDGDPFGAFVLDTGTEELREIVDLDGSESRAELERISVEVAEDIVDGTDEGSDQLDLVRTTQEVLAGVQDGVDAARRAAWRIGPALVALSAAVTWVVVGRALRPTRRIATEAASIDTDHLDRRLTRNDDSDEVDTIARVINDMLDRIEDGLRREQQFVADASHELRTPLATTRMAAELAGGDAPESPYPPQVVEEVDRMQALVDDLLELSRGGGRRAEPIDVAELVETTAERHPRSDLIELIAPDRSDASQAVVMAAPSELRRVVTNLLDNATRHASTAVHASVQVGDRSVLVHIDDDGSGIAADDRDRAFERFTRLDEGRARDDGGSGLGLAIVSALVTRHGGTVDIEDSPLGGARVSVRLPLHDAERD